MTEQGKTLGQLNVQPGDVVRCMNDGGCSWWTVGKEYHVYESEDGPIIRDDDGYPRRSIPSAFFTIVSRNEVNPSQDGASIPPADPKPVTWPDGVVEMRFGDGRDNITIAGGYISINDGTLSFKPTNALQLAALLKAAADYVEGGEK